MQSLRRIEVAEFSRVVHRAHTPEVLLIGVIFPEGRLRRTPTPRFIMAEARRPVNAIAHALKRRYN
jgi:hypothetical protein